MDATAKPTMKDVARLSGFSTASVSYVLNPRSDRSISPATASRILHAAEQLGYVANSAAAALRRGHSNVVLVALDPTFIGEVSERSKQGIRQGLTSRGYASVFHTVDTECELLKVAQAVQPYAVMLFAFISAETRTQLRAAGARHIVGFERKPGETEDSERPWEAAVGRAQVEYLAATGYQNLIYALPTASPRLVVAKNRLHGARNATLDLGLPALSVISLDLDCESIVAALSRMKIQWGKTALCAHDDRLAIAVLGAISDMGRKAPDDIAVIGSDNIAESAFVRPSLSTVAYPETEMATLAPYWLEAAVAGDESRMAEALSRVPAPAVIARQSA